MPESCPLTLSAVIALRSPEGCQGISLDEPGMQRSVHQNIDQNIDREIGESMSQNLGNKKADGVSQRGSQGIGLGGKSRNLFLELNRKAEGKWRAGLAALEELLLAEVRAEVQAEVPIKGWTEVQPKFQAHAEVQAIIQSKIQSQQSKIQSQAHAEVQFKGHAVVQCEVQVEVEAGVPSDSLGQDPGQNSGHSLVNGSVNSSGNRLGNSGVSGRAEVQRGVTANRAIAPESKPMGMILSGPVPVFSDPNLAQHFHTWLVTPEPLDAAMEMPLRLLPAAHSPSSSASFSVTGEDRPYTLPTLPLLASDPMVQEPFCLVLGRSFCAVLVLGKGRNGCSDFVFSFDPAVVQDAWTVLRLRLLFTAPHQVPLLDQWVERFAPLAPSYQTVMMFTRRLLHHLPTAEPSVEREDYRGGGDRPESSVRSVPSALLSSAPSSTRLSPDVEILRAIAHEVRTPLATIRTLIRLLLKRQDLTAEALKRLEAIDAECTEQIDRFGLIFRAAELETQSPQTQTSHLCPTPLAEVFQQGIPRWQQRARRRNLSLEVVLPQTMPKVVSDPVMLDQALTGLIDRYTRNLPARSYIKIYVCLAGNQLKLQLQSWGRSPDPSSGPTTSHPSPTLKSLGQLLMFQPETGSVSLNLTVTKNLFQALGGKLIVKNRPQQGEVLTVFLPLELNSSGMVD